MPYPATVRGLGHRRLDRVYGRLSERVSPLNPKGQLINWVVEVEASKEGSTEERTRGCE